MIKSILFTLGLGVAVSCAHYPDVRPGEKSNRVVVSEESEEAAFHNAMGQAKDYCDDAQNKKKPVIVKEEKKYVGAMDEDTYKKTKTVTLITGSIASVVGGKKERESGAAVRDVDMGKPYEVTLQFKCK